MSDSRISRLIFSALMATVATLLLLFFTPQLEAQSGRRQQPKTKTVPVEEPSPTPAQKSKSETTKPEFTIAVAIERSSFEGIPNWYFSTVLNSCADRLQNEPGVKVSAGNTDVTRADAVNAAKNSKDTHVVWLQLRNDSLSADRSWSNVYDITIEYFVYAPVTAKVVTSGRAYQRGYRTGPVVLGPSTTGRNTSPLITETLLKESARDVADRILSALHIRSTPPPGP